MMGRNIPVCTKTPLGGGRYADSKGNTRTPHPGIPERNAISKDIGCKHSGDRCQGHPECPPERFVAIVPAVPGVA
jgi:hypothetical protein